MTISSGSDEIREERINHCRPAIGGKISQRDVSGKDNTFSAENLCDAVLLMKEALLVDLVEEAALAIPGGYGSKVLLTLLFRTNVAHLDDD